MKNAELPMTCQVATFREKGVDDYRQSFDPGCPLLRDVNWSLGELCLGLVSDMCRSLQTRKNGMPTEVAIKTGKTDEVISLAARVASGPKRMQTQKRNLVREEILRSAANLFADRGVRGVSIEEVANGLGYKKSSVYYYFKSKDDLLWDVFRYISEHFVGEAERLSASLTEPLDRLAALIRMHVRFLSKHKEWATVFYRDASELPNDRQSEVHAIIVRYDGFFRLAVQEALDRRLIRPLPVDIVVNIVLGACNWMVNWIGPRHSENVEEIATTYVTLLLDGLVDPQRTDD